MENNKDYKLDKLTIEYNGYGEHKGMYTGTIKFQNGQYESFVFNIPPEKTEGYLKLVAEEIVRTASALGDNLLKTLKLANGTT